MDTGLQAGQTTRRVVYAIVIMLAVLHQDLWLWDNRSLVFGFLPIGLAYHAAFSLLAAGAWALVVKYAWPTDLEEFAEAPVGAGPSGAPAERMPRG